MQLTNPDNLKEMTNFLRDWNSYYTSRNPMVPPTISTMRILYGYATEGHAPGGHILSILQNDLVSTFTQLPISEIEHLRGTVEYITICMPKSSYGSYEKYDKWINDTKKSKMFKPTKVY